MSQENKDSKKVDFKMIQNENILFKRELDPNSNEIKVIKNKEVVKE
jgi:hypothetical protein